MYLLSTPRKLNLVCFGDLLFAHLLFLVFFTVEARLPFCFTFEPELLSKVPFYSVIYLPLGPSIIVHPP